MSLPDATYFLKVDLHCFFEKESYFGSFLVGCDL